MNARHAFHKLLAGLMAVALLTTVLSACQSIGTSLIAPDKRIALQPGGPHQGEADTGDLVVAYTYRLLPDQQGQIQISGGIRSSRTRGDMTNVYLNFVNDTGQVLDRKILYSSGFKKDVYTRRPSTFDTTLTLPPDTVAIAFSSYVQAGSGHK